MTARNAQHHNLGTVLVIGGCGFLGSHIVDQLVNDPACGAVAVISRNPKKNINERASYYAGDILDGNQMRSLLDQIKPQAIIDVASAHPEHSPAHNERMNVFGIEGLLKAAAECPSIRAFVYTSNNISTPSSQKPFTEDEFPLYNDKTAPNYNSKGKAAAERLVLAANKPSLRTATIRIPLVYGERDDRSFVTYLADNIRKGQHKNQVGDDTKLFEVVYVGNAAHGHICAMKALLALDGNKQTSAPEAQSADGQAYFISDGQPKPCFAFLRRCCAVAGYPIASEEITKIPFKVALYLSYVVEWGFWLFTLGRVQPPNGMRSLIISLLDRGEVWDLTKARTRLGYSPIVEQEEGIERAMSYMVKELL